ncbi:MAG: cupin domain-containing protein [Halopseudomonas sp.]
MTPIHPLAQLGSLDTETFLREYWQRKPCLFRNAFAEPIEVASPDELAGMACEDAIESRLLISDPSSGKFELRQGPFAEQLFEELPSSHWTLLIQGVDLWLPEAADLVERFKFIPNWRLDDLMISFATRGGGVGPHYDNYDVFIIQTQGRRRWEIGGHYREQDSEFLADQPVKILKHWQPEQSWDLEPGDMIYIPPRVGHNGIALTDDCINYSVGYRAPHATEMLTHLAEYCTHHCPDELRYSDPKLGLRAHTGEIQADDLDRVQQLLQKLIGDPNQLQRWWGEYVTEAKHPEHDNTEEPLSHGQLHQQLEQSDSVRRSEGVRIAYSRHAQGGYLFAEGRYFELEPAVIPLAELLSDQNRYTTEQIATWLKQPQALEILLALFSRDQLYCL